MEKEWLKPTQKGRIMADFLWGTPDLVLANLVEHTYGYHRGHRSNLEIHFARPPVRQALFFRMLSPEIREIISTRLFGKDTLSSPLCIYAPNIGDDAAEIDEFKRFVANWGAGGPNLVRSTDLGLLFHHLLGAAPGNRVFHLNFKMAKGAVVPDIFSKSYKVFLFTDPINNLASSLEETAMRMILENEPVLIAMSPDYRGPLVPHIIDYCASKGMFVDYDTDLNLCFHKSLSQLMSQLLFPQSALA